MTWLIFADLFQSKSLIGDTSILFSPPSLIKDTLGGRTIEEAFEKPKQKQNNRGKMVGSV